MGAAALPLAIAGAVVSTAGTIYGTQAREEALEARQRQLEMAATQQKLQEDEKIRRVLSTQHAVQAATPFKTESASFGVISEESIDAYARDREITNLNLDLQNESIYRQIDALEGRELLGVANNLFDAGMLYYRLKPEEKGGKPEEKGGIVEYAANDYDPRRFEEEFY